MAIIRRIIRQHVEETAHLWWRRELFAEHPEFDRTDLGRLDTRLRAHIAGLDAAGAEAWPLALQQFEDYPEPGEAYTLVLTALMINDAPQIDDAFSRVFAYPMHVQRGAAQATAWCGTDILRRHLDGWLYTADPDLVFLALEALSIHRTDPGRRLAQLQSHPDGRVAASAARLIGELGRTDLSDQLTNRLDDADSRVAEANLLALARLTGGRDALERLRHAPAALDWALMLPPPEEVRSWLNAQLEHPETQAKAMEVLGIFADPSTASVLFDAMEQPDLAHSAGCAFRDLLAVDFNDWDVFTDDPARMPSGFQDRDDSPWPMAPAARQIWDDVDTGQIKADFTSMRRHKLNAIVAARQDRSAVIANWRAPVDYPAWS